MTEEKQSTNEEEDAFFSGFRYPSSWNSLIEKRLQERGMRKAEYARSLLRKDILPEEKE